MKFISYLAFILCVMFSISCSNDFETSAEWKEIAVVYGILDQQDSAQYIVVQRAFLNREGNNLIGLQEPDSIYFTQALTVEITEFDGEVPIQTQLLELVNGEDEGIIRDEGLFPQSPNYLYKYAQPVQGIYEYELNINNLETGNAYMAKTPVVDDLEIINLFTNSGFNFADESLNKVSWFSTDHAAVYQLKIELVYQERDTTLAVPISVTKTIDQIVETEIRPTEGSTVSIEFLDADFFNWLNQGIAFNPDVERCFSHINLVLLAGSEDLYNLVRSQQAQFGLTQFQIQESYTNIEGDDALGIFASRTGTRLDSLNISSNTFLAILAHPQTSSLHFAPYICD